MKKTLAISFLLTVLLSLCLAGCNKTEQPAVEESKTMLISSSESMSIALDRFVALTEDAKTDEEKRELESQMNEYLLDDLSGFYYYLRPAKALMHVDSDNRAIYVKSADEVYIAPCSAQDLEDAGLSLEDIAQMENCDVYRYHVEELESGITDWGEYRTRVVLRSDYISGGETNGLNSVQIACYYGNDPMEYQIYGYFADEQDLILDSDRKAERGAVRDYFRDSATAASQTSQRNARESSWFESEEKAEPAIGMTKSEVLASTWGSPDTKNIDEYSWGATEQWVYEGRGYVYFENGVVDAIQHR